MRTEAQSSPKSPTVQGAKNFCSAELGPSGFPLYPLHHAGYSGAFSANGLRRAGDEAKEAAMTYPFQIQQANPAELTDGPGVYLPTGPGDAQRMELLNMPGDGSDVWLDVRAVQLYLQISNTSIYKLIHAGEIPAVKLGTKTIRINRKALEEYLQRALVTGLTSAA